MGIATRHTRRILAAYRGEGRCRRRSWPPGPQASQRDARCRGGRCSSFGSYPVRRGQSHPSQRVAERARGHRYRQDHPAAHPAQRRAKQSTAKASAQASGAPSAHASGGNADPVGRQLPPAAGRRRTAVHDTDRGGRCHKLAWSTPCFCEHEDANSYFQLMQGLLRRCGIPLALYTDRHGVFRHTPGSGLPGVPTQFSRAMEELGIQMIFALSPQAKGRVERTAGTFQDRLVTELRLAGAGSIWEANRVLEQFLPRFNQRFGVPPQHAEPAFGPLNPELFLEQVLCFKHRRRVARDNTVRFQLHTLQLLPGSEHPSYAGAAVEILEGLAGRLSVRHEGRIVPAQEAPPSPLFLRTATGSPQPSCRPLRHHWPGRTLDRGPQTPGLKGRRRAGSRAITGSAATAGKPKAASARKPTFLQRERWKAIQKPGARGCRCERSSGSWESTGPPSRNTWTRRVLRRGNPARRPRRHHLIPWQPNRVTFMLAT